MPRNLGLVLSGGGARGAYQIGFWRAFREAGLRFDGVAGTSVGAINGALILQDDWELAARLWSKLTLSQILALSDDRVPTFHDVNRLDWPSLLPFLAEQRQASSEPLRQLLKKTFDEERIRRANREFFLVMMDNHGFRPRTLSLSDIPKGLLYDYVLASAALPLVVRARLNGHRVYDGGLYNNLPISVLTRRRYRKIIAVKIARGLRVPYHPGICEVQIIRPSRSVGSLLCFEPDACAANLELGYQDGLAAVRRGLV